MFHTHIFYKSYNYTFSIYGFGAVFSTLIYVNKKVILGSYVTLDDQYTKYVFASMGTSAEVLNSNLQ